MILILPIYPLSLLIKIKTSSHYSKPPTNKHTIHSPHECTSIYIALNSNRRITVTKNCSLFLFTWQSRRLSDENLRETKTRKLKTVRCWVISSEAEKLNRTEQNGAPCEPSQVAKGWEFRRETNNYQTRICEILEIWKRWVRDFYMFWGIPTNSMWVCCWTTLYLQLSCL